MDQIGNAVGWKSFVKRSEGNASAWMPFVGLPPYRKGHPGYNPDSVDKDGFQWDEDGKRIGSRPAWAYGHDNYNPNARYPDGHYRDAAGRVIPQIGADRGKMQQIGHADDNAKTLIGALRSGRGGSGDPDAMLGDRMNPLVISAPMAAIGSSAIPSSGRDLIKSQIKELSSMSGLDVLSRKSRRIAKIVDMIRGVIPIVKTRGK